MKRFWMQSVKFSLVGLVLSGASSVMAAFPTAVNNQITDAVVQDKVTVLGDAPAEAMGAIYQTIEHSVDLESGAGVAEKDQKLWKQRAQKEQRSLKKG
jgi:hypothetical protein